jgi:hypothetical protein
MAVVFQAAGTVVANAGSAAVSWPTHLADDIGVLIIEYDPTGGTDPASLMATHIYRIACQDWHNASNLYALRMVETGHECV